MRPMRLALLVMLLLSATVHAAVLSLAPRPEKIEIEAGQGALAVAVGNLETRVLGARPAEATERLEPVSAPAVEATSADTAQPVTAAAAERPTTPAVTPEKAITAKSAAAMPLDPVRDPAATLAASPQRVAPTKTATLASMTEPSKPELAPHTPPRLKPTPPKPVRQVAPPKHKKRTAKPVRKRKVERKTARKTHTAKRRQTAGARTASSRGGDTPKKSTRRAVAGTSGRKTASNGRAALSNYQGLVARRLARAKRYPAAARDRRIEGVAVLRFTIRRNGSVSAVRIVKSSGAGLLDRAVRTMVARAAPFPPIPDSARRSSLTFTVPISFSLR